ncbi:flagellin [Alkalispirillum mobile]|uniref:Flagellin n=1 Tax=Alkalispirillum mobile TaxID=85925 RepID=A0A498C6N0_9GAMM|nr:flagellin [Alkalispirillum mobile]RLK51023.1 flagellin [Alkalispirillum mobile]
MSQVINTNIASLNAQRNLNSSQSQLNVSLERLSSGLRINSAKDDAAGLAISERFTAQINGNNQAARNANDGVSLAQTAEGALEEIGNIAQRVRELAVQSANDSNSASDRAALNQEVEQLVDEAGRIAESTEFNDQTVLDGALSDLFFQVGANQGQTIAVDGVDARSAELGRSIAEGEAGLTQDQISEGIDGIGEVTIELTDLEGFDVGEGIEIEVDFGEDVTSLEGMVREINSAIASFEGETEEETQAVRSAGLSAALTTIDGEDGTETTVSIRGAFAAEFEVEGGEITLEGEDTIDVFNGETGVEAEQRNLTDVDIGTRNGASEAIAIADGALDQINSLRADLGAVQNRFESTVANLNVTSENLEASRSRIVDADFAAETAALTRGQILQQAGTSVLAQANQIPNNVLGLLQ